MPTKQPIPRIVALHDLSCFGRSSLTIVLPVLSAMGIQVCPVPTAVLSTHSGDFEGYSFYDMTDSMEDTLHHWERLHLHFDGFYSGFLGSPKQGQLVQQFMDTVVSTDGLRVVDPVLGDEGELYSSVPASMIETMRALIQGADVITPNVTELCLLTGCSVQETVPQVLDQAIQDLAQQGPQRIVVTSYPSQQGDHIACRIYEKGHYMTVEVPRYPAQYPGTGDLFASLMTGWLMKGETLERACCRSAQFIQRAMVHSTSWDTPTREGVPFEDLLAKEFL